jgi:hypothetical protein
VEIIIHQSLCGENSKKAWDLLQTTMPDISIAKRIAFKTDLQDQAGGVAWTPTIRGFMQDDFFLLMKTYPDKSPDVRPGRAFSHVLLISKKDIDSIADIGSLFKYFPSEIEKSIPIEPIKFSPKELSGILLPNGFQERFNKAIHGFKNANDYKNTIIWAGEENFEQAVFRFWQVLSPSEKETLNIGIYFNPVAIPEGKLSFITTPENIESKFINRGYCLIRRNDTLILTDISEQFLAGEISAGQRISVFQDALETKSLSRTDIDKIAIVIKTFEDIDSRDDLKKLSSLSHVIAEFSPDEKKGIAFKEKLVDKISKLIEKGDVLDIPLVKKFNLKCFKGSEAKFSNAIINWLDNNLFSKAESKKQDFSTLFRQLRESATSNWWTKLIETRIESFLTKITSEKVITIFYWLQTDFEIFKTIRDSIDSSKESEKHFISELSSNFGKSNFAKLREFAVERGWYKFHSTLLIKEYPFEKAITEQLKVDTDRNSTEGVENICGGVKPKVIIDYTVSNGDIRLIDIAGKLCHAEPSELERIDFTNVVWQQVWLESIANGNKILDGFREPRKKIFQLFDSMIDGNIIDQQLLGKLEDTEFGNLMSYDKREALWNKFPPVLQTKYLTKTASALLESVSKDSTIEIPVDKILADYIVKYAIGDFLYFNPIKNALAVFERYTNIPEHFITTYIRNYQNQISVIEATQLGRLIQERNYKSVAYAVYSKASKSNNWKYALAECHFQLDFFTKGALVFSGVLNTVNITTDQWWESAEEIIIDLYPNANSLVTIWKKAGGEEADLLMNATPRNVWSDAIHNLRVSKFSEIDMCKLLKQIKKDYGDNERFKIIYSLRKSYLSC